MIAPVTAVSSISRVKVDGGRGGRPKRAIKIVETGETFESVFECAQSIGGSSGTIIKCIDGYLPSYKGYHFEYLK